MFCTVQIPHCSAQPSPGPSHLLPRAPGLFFSEDEIPEIRIWVGGLAEQNWYTFLSKRRREGGGTLLANPGPDPQTFPSWPRPTPHFPKVLGFWAPLSLRDSSLQLASPSDTPVLEM